MISSRESVDFRGINRHKMVYFLHLLVKNHEEYDKQHLREWHLQRDLSRIKTLSKNWGDGEELLLTIKDMEKKLTRFFKSRTNMGPKDKDLLKNIHKELEKINSNITGAKNAAKKETVNVKNAEDDDQPYNNKAEDEQSYKKKAEDAINNLLRHTHDEKIKDLEKRYNQLKDSPYVDKKRLLAMQKQIERLKGL